MKDRIFGIEVKHLMKKLDKQINILGKIEIATKRRERNKVEELEREYEETETNLKRDVTFLGKLFGVIE